MSAENGQKEKKPFKIKEFFKSTSFKCIAVLLAIVLVCGILLTICNSLFKVTDQERLDRVLSQIYGESVETKEHKLTEYETTEFDNGSINNVYEVTSDGNYLISSTGTGGFSGGTVTCWVVIEMTDGSVSGIGNVVVSENTNQSWIANVPDSAFEHFGESYTDGETFDVSDWQDNGLTGGATGSTTAIVNAVNTALLFARSQIAGEVIEPDVNPFEDFDYTEYIDTTATTVALNADGSSVDFNVVTTALSPAQPFTVNITVGADGVISDFTITVNGSSPASFADDMAESVLDGTLYEGKNAEQILALLGGENSGFTPGEIDETLHTGASYSNFLCTYAALFAAANYENGYIMALENSVEHTDYIDLEATSYSVENGVVNYTIVTTALSPAQPFTVNVTVGADGVISDFTITVNGSSPASFADDMAESVLDGTLYEGKNTEQILALLGGENSGFTPGDMDETLHTGASYSNFLCTYAALFAAANYEVYTELAQYLPPAFEYTDYINVDETEYTVESGVVNYTIVTTALSPAQPFTVNVTVGADGVISDFTITVNGSSPDSFADSMKDTVLDGTLYEGKNAEQILALLGGENSGFTPGDMDETLHTGASYSNFLCTYAALFAAANYQLLGGAEV